MSQDEDNDVTDDRRPAREKIQESLLGTTEEYWLHVGNTSRVVHCRGAIKSYQKAIQSVNPKKRKGSLTNTLAVQIERLANGGQMSRENFPREAQLPDKSHFYAMKKIPIRGYCFKVGDTWYVSHYIHKNFDDLADGDTEKVKNNWRRIVENGDER